MKTKADLRRMMLAHLTVIDATEDPETEVARTADLWIDTARAMLLERGLCWWDADAIPDAIVGPFAIYCASLSPGTFGRAGKGYEAQGLGAKRTIASLKSSAQRPDVKADYS